MFLMDIQQRLSKLRFFDVKPDFSSLSDDEKKALGYCVDASNIMTDIYLDQVGSNNRKIYNQLRARGDAEGKDLLKYFLINGSPWDKFDGDKPFIPGVGKRPKFGSFYPVGLKESEWNDWLKQHPEDREEFEDHNTVIKRRKNGLVAVAYSEEYKDRLDQASGNLRRARHHLPEGKLKTFLESRANAFISNEYFNSDMAWVDTDGNPFEVTIGPYEVYFDELLGLKASFESFVALPDKDATQALAKFGPKVPGFDRMLSEEFDFSPKGSAIPLEVVSDVIRGGEVAFGYLFVAYNLPNDRKVHDLKGSKKVFSRTMMEAKFNTGLLPTAERVIHPRYLDSCTFDNRLLFVLGHELAHGLGPNKVKVDGREIPFETALKDLHSSIEEAKADVLGVRLLDHFRKEGLIDDKTLEGILITNIAGFFQQWNKGVTEAYASGNLVEYNWLKESGALRYDTKTQRYEIDLEPCVDSMSKLSTEFLKLQMSGDYEKAKAFMNQWSSIPPEIPEVIRNISDVPMGVVPVWDLSGLR